MVLLDSLDVQRALRLGLTGVSHGRVDDDQVCWSRVGLHVAGGRASRPLCSHDDAWCLSQVDVALCVPNITLFVNSYNIHLSLQNFRTINSITNYSTAENRVLETLPHFPFDLKP